MPTMLEIADAQLPKEIHGKSMLPALRGEEDCCREIAVTSPTLKDHPEMRVYSTITDGERILIHAGRNAQPELYHLSADPLQKMNVISENEDIAKRLHHKYYNMLKTISTTKEKLELQKWIF